MQTQLQRRSRTEHRTSLPSFIEARWLELAMRKFVAAATLGCLGSTTRSLQDEACDAIRYTGSDDETQAMMIDGLPLPKLFSYAAAMTRALAGVKRCFGS